jgi:hypothetical protein
MSRETFYEGSNWGPAPASKEKLEENSRRLEEIKSLQGEQKKEYEEKVEKWRRIREDVTREINKHKKKGTPWKEYLDLYAESAIVHKFLNHYQTAPSYRKELSEVKKGAMELLQKYEISKSEKDFIAMTYELEE